MRTHRNGSLTQAMTLLIQNQAAFVAQLAENQRTYERLEARMVRVERSLEEIKAVLMHHQQMLTELSSVVAQLPEAVAKRSDSNASRSAIEPLHSV
jgi:hypothetical protein